VVAGVALLLSATMSGAQTGPALVIVRPSQASTSDPDVLILVEIRGGRPSVVRFVARIDGTPVRLEDVATGRMTAQGSVSPGRQARYEVRGVPEGTHQLQVIPVSASAVEPSPVVTFKVDAGRTSLVLVIAALLAIAGLFVFRRRVLSPMGDRYERPPPPEPEGRPE
jgi:hypothetical protein